MNAAVKLDQSVFSLLAVGVSALATLVGCAQSPAPAAAAPASTTELRAAELPAADVPVAPRVGKAQREDVDADAEPSKADPARRDHRPAGGFSGYK
jgi:hypothetical protein